MKVPKRKYYDGIIYYYKSKIKDNMYLYESKKGTRICFDNYELRLNTYMVQKNNEIKKWHKKEELKNLKLYNQYEEEQIVTLYNNCVNIKDISEAFGYTNSYIINMLKKIGVYREK